MEYVNLHPFYFVERLNTIMIKENFLCVTNTPSNPSKKYPTQFEVDITLDKKVNQYSSY